MYIYVYIIYIYIYICIYYIIIKNTPNTSFKWKRHLLIKYPALHEAIYLLCRKCVIPPFINAVCVLSRSISRAHIARA